MLASGLFENLRQLFSAAGLVSTVTPVFIFALVNALIHSCLSGSSDSLFLKYFNLNEKPAAPDVLMAMVLIFVVAFILSSLRPKLRGFLEGKGLDWWPCLLNKLREGEQKREGRFKGDSDRARDNLRTVKSEVEDWTKELHAAYVIGLRKSGGKYSNNSNAHQKIGQLREARFRGEKVEPNTFRDAVSLLKSELESQKSEDGDLLSADQDRLIDLLDGEKERAREERTQLYNRWEFNFPRGPLAPTRMGNIARTIESYASTRYRINFDFFWTRFLKIIQGDAEFYQTLQSAKTRLDFTVSMFWLTVVTTIVWLVMIPVVSTAWIASLIIGIAGPLVAAIWYRIAVENYRNFADVVRASIDLFRFELLKKLRVSLPADSVEEQETWVRLRQKLAHGDDNYFHYDHS